MGKCLGILCVGITPLWVRTSLVRYSDNETMTGGKIALVALTRKLSDAGSRITSFFIGSRQRMYFIRYSPNPNRVNQTIRHK